MKAITYISEQDTDYASGLKAAQTELGLRTFLDEWTFLAQDACRCLVNKFNWEEFAAGRKLENSGQYAGDEWNAKYGAILIPEMLLRVSVVAMEFSVPWGCAYIRLRETGTIRETNERVKWQPVTTEEKK